MKQKVYMGRGSLFPTQKKKKKKKSFVQWGYFAGRDKIEKNLSVKSTGS